jgi:hypothetical protein
MPARSKARGSSKTARMFRDAIEKANGWDPEIPPSYNMYNTFLAKKVSDSRGQLNAELWFGDLRDYTTEDLATLVAKVRQHVEADETEEMDAIVVGNIQLHVQVEVDEAYERTGKYYDSRGKLDVETALRSVPIKITRDNPWGYRGDGKPVDVIDGFWEHESRDLPYRIVGAAFHYDPTHKVQDNEGRHDPTGAYHKALAAGVVYNSEKASFAQPFTNDQRAIWDATIDQVKTAIQVRADAIRLAQDYAQGLRHIQEMVTKRLEVLTHYMGSDDEDMESNHTGEAELERSTKDGRLEYTFGHRTQRGLTHMPMPSIDSGPGDNLTPHAGQSDMRLHALKAQLLGMWKVVQANMKTEVMNGELRHSTSYHDHQVPVIIEGEADFASRPIL